MPNSPWEFALVRRQFSFDQCEQRRLAATIGAGNTELLTAVYLEAGRLEQQRGRAPQSQVGKTKHALPPADRILAPIYSL
jgi:hypothetical protein